MRWGRVLLIVGATIGGIIVAFGILALVLWLVDSSSPAEDRNDGIFGGFAIIFIGLTIGVPCTAGAVLLRPRSPLPMWQSGLLVPQPSDRAVLPAAPQVDLRKSYVEWFGWCQREVGGDAIAMHAATIAALRCAATGDAGGALVAARRAALAASPGSMALSAPKVPPGKLRTLAMTGAALLPLLEEGETVLVTFRGVDQRTNIWRVLFGWVGYLIAASQTGYTYLTVTDRRAILLGGPQLGMAPRELLFAVPRSMVSEARFSKFLFAGRFRLARITGETNRMTVDRTWHQEALQAQRLLDRGSTSTPMPAAPTLG